MIYKTAEEFIHSELTIKSWMHEEKTLFIQPWCGHYNGYVVFKEKPCKEEGYRGILTYVPVHGGITYCRHFPDGGSVYGFDCAHSSDETDPRTKDLEWVGEQCRIMLIGIEVASKWEDDYLAAADQESRSAVLDKYLEALKSLYNIDFNLRDNFGAMLAALSGNL